MTQEERIQRVEDLTASIVVNLAVLIDKIHGSSEVPEEEFIAAVHRDIVVARQILKLTKKKQN